MARSAKKYGVKVAILAAAIVATLIIALAAYATLPRNPEPKSTLRIAVVTDALFSDRGWGESSLNAAKFIESESSTAITPR